jgi:hypothetical protein
MGNHIHLIVLVENPSMVESSMGRFKCETAHAVNRLLGRRQVTVWCEGYNSPAILTIDDLVEKLAYVYANPVRAHHSASISEYQGVSSWRIFTSEQVVREVEQVRRTFLVPIAFINNLREKARNVRREWLRGNWREPFSVGLFSPTQPMLANVLPAYFRRSPATM